MPDLNWLVEQWVAARRHAEVWRYLVERTRPLGGWDYRFSAFWRYWLANKSDAGAVAALLDALVPYFPDVREPHLDRSLDDDHGHVTHSERETFGVDMVPLEHGQCDAGLSAEVLEDRASKHDMLNRYLAQFRESRSAIVEANRRSLQEREESRKDTQRTFREHLREHMEALRTGCAVPNLLHYLARVYLGRVPDAAGETPEERLSVLLDNQRDLVDAATQGLRKTLHRDDLPDVGDVAAMVAQSREPYLCLPFLAGLEETERRNPGTIAGLDQRALRRALAYEWAFPRREPPDWAFSLLANHPETSADVLVELTARPIGRGDDLVLGFYNETGIQHRILARRASISLLERFSDRDGDGDLRVLDILLWSALRWADRAALVRLAGAKMSAREMSVAQRARWLGAGLFADSVAFAKPLREFLSSDADEERRVEAVASFMAPSEMAFDREPELLDGMSPAAVRLLVSRLGAYYTPWDGSPDPFPNEHRRGQAHSSEANWSSTQLGNRIATAIFVERLIASLRMRPTKEVSAVLASLAGDQRLEHWRERLDDALRNQLALRRDTEYRHPSIEEFCRTMDGGAR